MMTRSVVALVATGCAVVVAVGAGAVAAHGHGYVGGQGSGLVARAALTQNTGLGSVAYEPQSLEAPKGFPAGGPADGRLASAGGLFGGTLDEQSATRWMKNTVRPGANTVSWHFTAPHSTAEWRYYLTKVGWDPNDPLDRGDFELLQTVRHDGTAASMNPSHVLDIPADRTGYHVIYAVWDIADTSNAFYNVIDINVAGEAIVDSQAPATPKQLRSPGATSSSVSLSWAAATDNIGVNGYHVYRDGIRVGTTTSTAYTDTGLTPESAYRYTVAAFDGAGNVSPISDAITVPTTTVPATDNQPPTAPTMIHTMKTTANTVDLMWTAASDNVGVDHYSIARTDATTPERWAPVGTSTKPTFTDVNLTPATTYLYRVTAHDASGNATTSAPFRATTKATTETGASPEWNPRRTYTKGDRVTHHGHTYQAVQTHTGNGDPNWINAPSLWKRHH